MNYIEIVKLIGDIFGLCLMLMCAHFAFFAAVGLFCKKKFPKTETKLRYGIIIPARNEEAVVGNLIDSMRMNNYPQDKLDIFVIAHNCTDKTAEISRERGAIVYEYNNENEKTMGYAFRYLFDRIREDYGVENYDGFFLFNADNILDVNYFDKMNDAFVACGKKDVITSFRNSKNFGENPMSALYGLYFAYGCCFESRGRTVMGCSTRVQGTGYVINSDIVKNGWPYVTLTEDWEFTADRILLNEKIRFCDEAVFYDEQPTKVKVMVRQRLRWAKGHLLVCITRFKDMLGALLKPKSRGGIKNKGSMFDFFVNCLPVCVIATALSVLQFIALLLSPLFGHDLLEVLGTAVMSSLPTTIITYVGLVILSILIYVMEAGRIKNVKLWIRIASALLWPLFLMLAAPIEVVALFWRNLQWKEIPHTNTTDFATLNEDSEQAPELERQSV